MSETTKPEPAISSPVDLFDDAVVADPYPTYAELRKLGPAVYLERANAWALPHYDSVKAALNDTETFSSVNGLHLNPEGNQWVTANSVLATDGLEHARLRRVLSKELAPRAIKDLGDDLRKRADVLVAGLADRESFDAVADLAAPYVTTVILDLMGLPHVDGSGLMKQIESVFDTFAAPNQRTYQGLPSAQAMFEFLQTVATRDNVRPDSWLGAAHAAADRGEIAEHECVMTMAAYLTAGMDTTIHAIATAVHHLTADPAQWALVRDGEVGYEALFGETLRYDAPIQGFGRRVVRETRIGDAAIAEGDQVWVMFGSSGRDEAKWGPDADRFDVRRPGTAEHLALGYGAHLCAGNHLALMEFDAVFGALGRHFPDLSADPSAQPERVLNNVLRVWSTMPVRTRG
ncbi:MAG: cytochrome P450 [Streptomycetaceae bacterium]|nr:cytochrome P450 [Streptomycetaceae bacterium]